MVPDQSILRHKVGIGSRSSRRQRLFDYRALTNVATMGKPTMWEPNQRYPDQNVQVLAPSFNKLRLPLASVEQLATGCRWSEGPVYFGDGRYLLWSDIPNDRILKWEEETGAVSVFRKTSWNANGNTRD